MTPEQWRQIEDLYSAAKQRVPAERAELFAGMDSEIRSQVERMLAQDSDGKILDRAAASLIGESTETAFTQTMVAMGSRLGPYEIESELGAGGMGKVYLARDTRLGRDVAIKVSQERFNARFEREARAIAALNHPNICQLYDVGDNYLVMELIEGPTLQERLRRGPLPVEEAVPIARQIADALDAAQEKGIIHRDLKPGNIKLKPDGTVKVLDFGLAKVAEGSGMASDASRSPTLAMDPTVAGMILGTAYYMAPEQAKGRAVDKRADIWAFGVVLFEMLSGRKPFEGGDVAEILAAILRADPEWAALPKSTPANIRALLARCLEKDPKRRLRDIGEARILLDDPRPAQIAGEPKLRTSGIAWKFAVAVLAVAVLILGGFVWRGAEAKERPLLRLNVDLSPNTVSGSAVISPDGSRIVFSVAGEDGESVLATRLLDQAQPTVLPGTENGHDPFFSPNGQWVAFFASGQLKRISLAGGGPTAICAAPAPRGGAWGDDDYIVAALSNFGGLSRVPANGGPPQPLTQLASGEATHRWPQVLPGSRVVLFTSSTNLDAYDDANLDLVEIKSGKRETARRSGYFGRFLPTRGDAGHLVFVHQGVLWAAPFDPSNPATSSTPVPVIEDLAGDATSGQALTSFSQSGIFVYQSGNASQAGWPVVWLDRTGKPQPLIKEPGRYYTPRLAPDGSRLAISENTGHGLDLFLYDWRRDTKTPLTFTGQDNINPAWAPDNLHIAFRTRSGANGLIEWVRADGSGQPRKLLESKGTVEPYSFSPDGKYLAYEEFLPETGFDIWILPLDLSDPDRPKPGNPELFLRTAANEQDPSFSPDGKWIAYRSNESGAPEIWVQPFPKREGAGKWRASSAGGQTPKWSRNQLFFLNSQQQIMVAGYSSSGDSFRPEKPRLWAESQDFRPANSNFDITPDATRFVMFPATQQAGQVKGSTRFTFLLNFFDQLRRQVPK